MKKHLAEKFGVSRGTVDNWAKGTKSPLASGKWKGSKVWAENKKLFKHLGKELSFNKYKSLPDGTPRLIWDMSEIIQNKLPTAFAGPGEHLPHKFIMDSAHRHNKYAKDAGKSSQVRFIDKNYELLPRSEWKFIKGDKLYSMEPALGDVVFEGTTYKNNYLNHVDAPNLYKNDFGDVYRAFDDLDVYMNTKVPNPKNPKKQILLDTLLRRQAYDETGKEDFLRRRFAELDHFDGVDKKPFSNIRLLDRRTNTRAGMLKRFDKYKKNPKLLNKVLADRGYLIRDKDVNAFIKRMTKKAGLEKVKPTSLQKLMQRQSAFMDPVLAGKAVVEETGSLLKGAATKFPKTTAVLKSIFETRSTPGAVFWAAEAPLLMLQGTYNRYANERDFKAGLKRMGVPDEAIEQLGEVYGQELADIGQVGLESWAVDQPDTFEARKMMTERMAEKKPHFEPRQAGPLMLKDFGAIKTGEREIQDYEEQLKQQEIEKRTREGYKKYYETYQGRNTGGKVDYDNYLPDIDDDN